MDLLLHLSQLSLSTGIMKTKYSCHLRGFLLAKSLNLALVSFVYSLNSNKQLSAVTDGPVRCVASCASCCILKWTLSVINWPMLSVKTSKVDCRKYCHLSSTNDVLFIPLSFHICSPKFILFSSSTKCAVPCYDWQICAVSLPKASSIPSAASIERRLVTDRH